MATKKNDGKHAISVLWRIETVSLWESGPDEKGISGPDFTPHAFEGKSLRLVVLRKVKESVGKFLCFSLIRDGDAFDFPIDCELSLIDQNGLPFNICTQKNYVFEENGLLILCSVANEYVFGTNRSKFLPLDILTVRCLIWASRGNFSEAEFISTRTRIESLENSFLWSIPKISTLALDQEMTFPVRFSYSNLSNDFEVKFSFRGESLPLANFCVEFKVVSIPFALMVSLNVSVLTNKGKAMITAQMKYVAGPLLFDIPICALATREVLLRQNACFTNDTLSLLCKIISVQSTNMIDKQMFGFPNAGVDILETMSPCFDVTSTSPRDDTRYISLIGNDSLGDLLILYKDKIRTDFELRLGEVSFPVHKLIISARSAFFRTLFSSSKNELDSNFMNVSDLDVQTLKRMITFLYSGAVRGLSFQDVIKLYSVAVQYQVQSLSNKCRSFLRSYLNLKTVCGVLKLADRHGHDELESVIYEFMMKNFNEIIKSSEWETFVKHERVLALKWRHNTYLKYMESKHHEKQSISLC